MNALKTEVTSSVHAALTANWGLHQELVDLLIKYKSLEWHELEHILSRVVYPKTVDVAEFDGGAGI